MKSMTGFGIGEYTGENESISVEIKTVNHRYKDFNMRLSGRLSPLEDNVRKLISSRISRGHVEVSARLNRFGEANINLHYDKGLASSYKQLLDRIAADFPDADNEVEISDIAHYPGVITSESVSEDLDELWKKFSFAIEKALGMAQTSREEEGESLKVDFIMRLDLIEKNVAMISKLSENLPKEYYESLKRNVADCTDGLISEERLLTELAVYADRVNVTEELVRLSSHIKNFRITLALAEPVGRKLDFMLQEINREVNTIASKSNSFEVSSIVVEIKAELEKLREQVQNIE